ncbi:hypothetical protein YC2023_026887 [Brassica napus]
MARFGTKECRLRLSQKLLENLPDDFGIREEQQFVTNFTGKAVYYYIVRNGIPVMVPTNPIALVTSRVLSTQSKINYMHLPVIITTFTNEKVKRPPEECKTITGPKRVVLMLDGSILCPGLISHALPFPFHGVSGLSYLPSLKLPLS